MLVNILNDEINILIVYMIVLYIELLFILVFEMGRLIKDFVCFLGKIELILEVRYFFLVFEVFMSLVGE